MGSSSPEAVRDAARFEDLLRRLADLDGRGYGEYRSIKGSYDASFFRLAIDHVQGDPFAAPSRIRALVPASEAGLPEWALRSRGRRIAAADFISRVLHASLSRSSKSRGSGRGGEFRILPPGQEVLPRSCVLVGEGGDLEARFRVGLPAHGRRILGRQAAEMFGGDVLRLVQQGLRFESLSGEALRSHLETVEDAQALRAQLGARGLVAFVADGAILPRRSGVDDRPLTSSRAVPFRAPDSLRVTLDTPNAGPVVGMGIPRGITLVVGGGYHGKSTLLRAFQRGVFDHVPGDGRERVVTTPGAVKVRAEDGRSIAGTDISNFIGDLPGGADPRGFRTANASGSTSQAAAIIEALEVGATCLLLDEDTSATNFMIRDGRMQVLVDDEFEPITPFIDRAHHLAVELGVSSIVVVGGSGDYFDIADTVIAMRRFVPSDETEGARRVAREQPTTRRREGGAWRPIRPRVPRPSSLDPARGRKGVHIKTPGAGRVMFGSEEVDLSAVEQVVELAQARAMAEALVWGRDRAIDGTRSVADALEIVMAAVESGGLDAIHPAFRSGELAAFRIFELAALMNRIRRLQVAD